MLCAAFLYLHFGFVIFFGKNINAKAAHKMSMILTTDEDEKVEFDIVL